MLFHYRTKRSSLISSIIGIILNRFKGVAAKGKDALELIAHMYSPSASAEVLAFSIPLAISVLSLVVSLVALLVSLS